MDTCDTTLADDAANDIVIEEAATTLGAVADVGGRDYIEALSIGIDAMLRCADVCHAAGKLADQLKRSMVTVRGRNSQMDTSGCRTVYAMQ